jgi:hypothetical protein
MDFIRNPKLYLGGLRLDVDGKTKTKNEREREQEQRLLSK